MKNNSHQTTDTNNTDTAQRTYKKMTNHYHKKPPCKLHFKTQADTYSQPDNANKKLFNKRYKKNLKDGKLRLNVNNTSIIITITLTVSMGISPANRSDSHEKTQALQSGSMERNQLISKDVRCT